MVKSILFGIFVLIFTPRVSQGDILTNALDIVGLHLGTNVLYHIESRDCSSPDRVVLGNIKAMVLGNVRDQFFYFSDALRESIVGGIDETCISEEMESSFREVANGGRFTEFVVSSITHSNTNSLSCWDVSVQVRQMGFLTTNTFSLVLVQTNLQWRVEDWQTDGCSLRND